MSRTIRININIRNGDTDIDFKFIKLSYLINYLINTIYLNYKAIMIIKF